MDITEYYRLLKIEPTNSLKEIKQAYRDIVFVWYPKRMTSNSRIQKKAENKLKQINEAYKGLQIYLAPKTLKLARVVIDENRVTLENEKIFFNNKR